LAISVGNGDLKTVVKANKRAPSTLAVGDDHADLEMPPLDVASSYLMVSEVNTFAFVLLSPSPDRPMPCRFV
jgi:hypothetical protein